MSFGAFGGGSKTAAAPASQQMDKMMAEMQIKDTLAMYNTLVERCFEYCVDDFGSKELKKGEGKCVRQCADKFMKTSTRVSENFAALVNQPQ